MNYREVMSFLDNARVFGSILGLDTMRRLLFELHDPQKGLAAIHVAGTNGKGSTAAYLAGILHAAGYQTGLYISPFIQRFGERIQVNGVTITEHEIAVYMTKVIEAARSITAGGGQAPTVFELITAMGFLYFQARRCDIAVVEVGLGGRLDATNVIGKPEAAVITQIGLDHTELLGGTIPEIAAEKGGIVKPGCDVVLCRQSSEAMTAIAHICRTRNARLHCADAGTAVLRSLSIDGLTFDWEGYEQLRTSLTGLHQVGNAVTAVKTAQVLREKGWHIDEPAIRTGLRGARCIGRLEILRRKPLFLVDGAHNPQGVEALMTSLKALFPGKKFVFLMGMLADKDYFSAVTLTLPHAKRIYTMTPPVPRALGAEKLAEVIRSAGSVPVSACDTIRTALSLSLQEAKEGDVLCAFGSLYQIGEIRACFGLAKKEGFQE